MASQQPTNYSTTSSPDFQSFWWHLQISWPKFSWRPAVTLGRRPLRSVGGGSGRRMTLLMHWATYDLYLCLSCSHPYSGPSPPWKLRTFEKYHFWVGPSCWTDGGEYCSLGGWGSYYLKYEYSSWNWDWRKSWAPSSTSAALASSPKTKRSRNFDFHI